MARAAALALLASGALCCCAAAPAAAQSAAPRVVSVIAVAGRERLMCSVRTEGLPIAKAIESMQGGLPSTIDFNIDLLDGRERTVSAGRVSFQLAFDLWEEIFRIEGGGRESRLETIEQVREFLAVLDRLPVAPLSSLRPGERYRVRVGVQHHAISPVERLRIGSLIAGDESGVDRDPDEREVSLGIGSLIRFFYGGSARESGAEDGESLSAWFRPEELSVASD